MDDLENTDVQVLGEQFLQKLKNENTHNRYNL